MFLQTILLTRTPWTAEKESNDERRQSEDEEDTEGSSATLGIAPYQFEPVLPVSAPANESPSDGSDENDEGPVWRLNNTNSYVIASSTEIVLLMNRFSRTVNN